MSKYFSLFKIRMIYGLQYRAAALAGISTQFAWGFMEILAFSAFYKENAQAFPMEFSQVTTYLWLQQAFLALFMTWFLDNKIFSDITSGNIAYELVRPMDLYNRWFTQNIANRISKTALRCAPILIVAFVLPSPIGLGLPKSIWHFLFFMLALVLGSFVVIAFSMIVYILVFYTMSSTGVRIIFTILADFLAGGVVPIPFFPENIRKVVEWLPFAAMQNTPFRIYSGNITGINIFYSMVLQIFWIIMLVFVGKQMIKNALSKVIVQGG